MEPCLLVDRFWIKPDFLLTTARSNKDKVSLFHVKLLGKIAKKAFNFTRKKRNLDRGSDNRKCAAGMSICGYYVKFENWALLHGIKQSTTYQHEA